MDIEIEGMGQLERLQKMLVEGEMKVPFTKMFPSDFMQRNTKFASFGEMQAASGLGDDFDAIPDKPWDIFIRENTKFTNWGEMLGFATEEWLAKELAE